MSNLAEGELVPIPTRLLVESTFNVVVSTVKSPVTFNAGIADVSNNLAGSFVFAIYAFSSVSIRAVKASFCAESSCIALINGYTNACALIC